MARRKRQFTLLWPGFQAWLAMLWVGIAALGIFYAPLACAAGLPDGTCTFMPQFNIAPPSPENGVVSLIIANVATIMDVIAQSFYTLIVTNVDFGRMAGAAVTLYVIIYAVLFTVGIIPITAMDATVRALKIAIVVALVSPTSWQLFQFYVVSFFNLAVNQMIYIFSTVAFGPMAGLNPDYPFAVLDNAINLIFSPKMWVQQLATLISGPYGPLFALLIGYGIFGFGKVLLKITWIFLISMVMRAILFGLGPIFICCILFSRTRHLFDGWVNQLVNATLQPILLFAFFAFFARLVEAQVWKILSVIDVCWVSMAQNIRGSPFTLHNWRMNVPGMPAANFGWEGDDNGVIMALTGQPFPLPIVDVLIFILLVELLKRMNDVVLAIASDIAGASLSMNMSNFSGNSRIGGGGTGANAAAAAENRNAPANVGARRDAANNVQPAARDAENQAATAVGERPAAAIPGPGGLALNPASSRASAAGGKMDPTKDFIKSTIQSLTRR